VDGRAAAPVILDRAAKAAPANYRWACIDDDNTPLKSNFKSAILVKLRNTFHAAPSSNTAPMPAVEFFMPRLNTPCGIGFAFF